MGLNVFYNLFDIELDWLWIGGFFGVENVRGEVKKKIKGWEGYECM